jgi:hypothetical protein
MKPAAPSYILTPIYTSQSPTMPHNPPQQLYVGLPVRTWRPSLEVTPHSLVGSYPAFRSFADLCRDQSGIEVLRNDDCRCNVTGKAELYLYRQVIAEVSSNQKDLGI